MRGDPEVQFLSVETTEKVIVLRFGQSFAVLDGPAAPRVGNLLDHLVLAVAQTQLVLDFANVTYLASAALGALVGLHKQALAVGKQLRVLNVREEVYEAFDAARLTGLLDIRRAAGRPPARSSLGR